MLIDCRLAFNFEMFVAAELVPRLNAKCMLHVYLTPAEPRQNHSGKLDLF